MKPRKADPPAAEARTGRYLTVDVRDLPRRRGRASQRVSVYLLGDFDADDVDDTPTPSPNACNKSPPLNVRRVQAARERRQRRSEPSNNTPTSPLPPVDQAATIGSAAGATMEPILAPCC